MAITGISAISGEQIIAAGAVSAKEAGKASFTTGGNDIQNLYDTVSTNSASWTSTPITFPLNVTDRNVYVAKNTNTTTPASAVANSKGLTSYFILDAGYPRQIDYTGRANYNGLEVETVDHYKNKTAYASYGVTGIYLSDNNSTGNISIESIQNWNSTHDTVSTNSASWTGGGGIDSAEASAIASSYADSAKNACWPMVSNDSYFEPSGRGFEISWGNEHLLVGKYYTYTPMQIDFAYGGQPTANFHLGGHAVYGGNLSDNTSYYYNLRWNGISGRYYDATANSACYWQYTLVEYNKLTSTHDTVSANSASWAASGPSYSAGNMISLANDTVSVSSQAGITDIVSATALPQNPVSTVLYLIPEA